MGWIDSQRAGVLSEQVNGITKIQDAIGDKVGTVLATISMLISSFAIALTRGWKMALVVISVPPTIAVIVLVMGITVRKMSAKSTISSTKAGGVAEEVIACIRTVYSFGLQELETKRYDKYLARSEAVNKCKGLAIGLGMGIMTCACICINALGFWYGSKLIRDGDMSAGEVITVFMSVMMTTMSLGGVSAPIQAISEGRGVARTLFPIVDRHSEIDPFSKSGVKPAITGNIEFNNVWFSYPTRASTPVLRGLSLSIRQGETVALVGPSGCGKSAAISLLERLYQPTSGTVTIDGTAVSDINLKHLRRHIGIVGQEPVLFSMSIRDNIALGLTEDVERVRLELIEQAAQQANAHDFIMGLPDQYETMVGERGVQLSGGQKQRIAIARALIRDPAILLLDEATSALDTESEAVVQQALDRASEGRTTVVITHRLSTVQNADVIYVISQGQVAELGKHDELMKLGSLYSALVWNQVIASAAAGDDAVKGSQHEVQANQQETEFEVFDLQPSVLQVPSTLVLSVTEAPAQAPAPTVTPAPVKVMQMFHNKARVTPASSETHIPPLPHAEETYKLSTRKMVVRLARLLKPDALVILGAVVFSLANGLIFPVFGFVMSKTMGVLVGYDGTKVSQFKREVIKWAFCFVGIGVGSLFANLGKFSFVLWSNESLVRRLRRSILGAVLRQDVGWFDAEENSVGVLTTKLAANPPLVEGAAGVKIASTTQSVAALIAGVAIGLAGCWQLACVILAIMMFFAFCNFLKTKLGLRQETKIQSAYEASGKVACEAIETVRTVAMLGRENKFLKKYKQALNIPTIEGCKSALIASVCDGLIAGSPFVVCAVCYWYGAKLIKQGKIDFHDLIQAQMGTMLGVMMFSTINAAAPDFGKAKVALRRIFQLLDSKPTIDVNQDGETLEEPIQTISLCNIDFSYPSRPGVQVLNNFSLEIPQGKTVALVGPSGCGKSTIMNLIQRFFDTLDGEIFFNDHEIRTLNLKWLRNQIGIVSQEPVLFCTTIKENIARGLYGEPASMEDIIAASKLANAHDFISALPQGYDTQVGEKGLRLSGGQRQRIAIARALVRNPKILLLDEATSALDTESEKVVQAALDHARKGRTTIVVAHRLATVKDADLIVAMAHGKVQETGTHKELLAHQGIYYDLARAQQLRTPTSQAGSSPQPGSSPLLGSSPMLPGYSPMLT
eukprot:TRINITY_DN712_c0_g1_i1.p1 TRINITY_DN712_c0_g1~~TRINITY_DN712_c0_g1_i1.p1  ORF type:complete len:1385 (-),score=274.12 TRINITY_DN712_c0_g1_i1:113-3682(-)